jgi:hypothetical protein
MIENVNEERWEKNEMSSNELAKRLTGGIRS